MAENKHKIRTLSNTELSSFFGQMALILSSGISPQEGLDIFCEEIERPNERAILETIISSMEKGEALSDGFNAAGVFPEYAVAMTRLGEYTGHLDEVMESLSNHYSREYEITQSIKSAVLYPAVIIALMIAVIVVLLVEVMPIFNRVFVQLGTEMTGFSAGLLSIGKALGRYSGVFAVILAIVVGLVIFCLYTAPGKRLRKAMGRRIGFSRLIMDEIESCRLAGGMALTLSGGIAPEEGLELVSSLSEDAIFKSRVSKAIEQVRSGTDLAKALHNTEIFTGIYAKMASVGSKTGSLDKAMESIAEQYQSDIDTRLSSTVAAIEPALVIILSIVVGVILLSVMLPLLGIMSGL